MRAKIICMALLCAIFFAGCKSKSGSYEAASSSADTTRIQANTDSVINGTKLVKTSQMRFKVENAAKTNQDITILANSYKGMVVHSGLQSNISETVDKPINNDSIMRLSVFVTDADMTVKIPAERADDFMNKVATMATDVYSRNMDVQDKTLDYLSARLKIRDRQEFIAAQKKGKVIIKNPADVIQLKDDLVDQQVNNHRIEDAVRYSTINLNFTQNNTIVKEIVPNTDPSAFTVPFANRLWASITNGLRIFADTIITLANLWLFALIGVAAWFIYRYYRVKKTHA